MASPTWSPDGSQLFWVTYSYGEASTVVGRIDVDSGATESVRLPVGGTLRAIAVERAEAAVVPAGRPGADPEPLPAADHPAEQPHRRVRLPGDGRAGVLTLIVQLCRYIPRNCTLEE